MVSDNLTLLANLVFHVGVQFRSNAQKANYTLGETDGTRVLDPLGYSCREQRARYFDCRIDSASDRGEFCRRSVQ